MSAKPRESEPSKRGYVARAASDAVHRLRTLGALLRELFQYMNRDKLWWISPIVVLLVILSVFLVLIEGSAVAPFIYAMF